MKKRNASIDLLRCILLFGVLMLHTCVHGLGIGNLKLTTGYSYLIIFLVGTFNIAVDTFFIISGYFHSKFKPKKAIEYVVMASVYAGIMYIVSCLIQGKSFSALLLASRIILGFKEYWFLVAYLVIFMFSDFINRLFENLSNGDFCRFIVIFTIINTLFGFLLDINAYGNGFTAISMFYCYSMGYAARRFDLANKTSKVTNIIGYILPTVITVCSALILIRDNRQEAALKILTDYRSPLMIIASLSLFLMFAVNIHITDKKLSEKICKAGASAFAVYLITDAADIQKLIFLPVVKSARLGVPSVILLIEILIYAAALFSVCIAVDIIRKKLYTKAEKFVIFLVNMRTKKQSDFNILK